MLPQADGTVVNFCSGNLAVSQKGNTFTGEIIQKPTVMDHNAKEEHRYCYKYPHPSVTTDCVIFGYDGHRLHVLMVERGGEPYRGCWAMPGGFLAMDESAEEGALRELQEETGLREAGIRQFHTFSAPGRDPRERVITIAFYALVPMRQVRGGDDAADARWFPLDEVPRLAFDHGDMLDRALQALRRQLRFEPVGRGLLPDRFTLRQLQQLYEAILGARIERRGFSARLQRLGVLERTGETAKAGAARSAALYRFRAEGQGGRQPEKLW